MQFRFLIMPTRVQSDTYGKDLLKAYQCWKEVWDNACKNEMNFLDPLYSDNFTRQSQVAVLFHGEEPVVLVTLNHFNLSLQMDLDDSYFKVWPDLAMRKLRKEASRVMSCGNLALNFNYRRKALGVSGKDLIFAILVHYLKYSSFDAMVAAVRLEKGMEKAAYRTGAHSLQKDLPYSIPGQRVDLVSWHRSLDENSIDPEVRNLARDIWMNSTIIVNDQNKQGVRHVA